MPSAVGKNATLLLAVLLALPAVGAEAQRRPPRFDRGAGSIAGGRQARGGDRGMSAGGPQAHHAGDWLRRYGHLPPAEQERALNTDQAFNQLPADKQQRLRERLRKFNSLPPEQRQKMLQRMDAFEHLAPEQRARAQQLFARLRELPEERRHMLHRALHHLRTMEPQERERVMESERFRGMFSEQELRLLHDMSELSAQLEQQRSTAAQQAPPTPKD